MLKERIDPMNLEGGIIEVDWILYFDKKPYWRFMDCSTYL